MSIATERRAQVSVQVGNQEISLETGHLAKQADGAVVIRGGDTMVLATAQGRAEAREGADFFPLTVDVEERMYAAGKIPGGFFKREGRPTERAILTARMIDRPIRPLWPKGFRNEVQVICTVLSADMVTAHDILCINGASAALMLSPLPFVGPVGAVRIGLIDGQLVVNPTLQESEENGELDLIVVGTKDGPDDGRGRRERDSRGEDPRGARARPRRDREALRGAGGSASPGRQAEVARPRAPRGDRARPRTHDLGADPAGWHQGVEHGRRRAPRRARAGDHDGVDRRRHPAPGPGQVCSRVAAREAAGGGDRRSGARAVRRRAEGAHRCGAGLEGAEVGEAATPLRPDHRAGRAAVPGRGSRDRRADGEGLADQVADQEGVRVDLQGPRAAEDRRRQAAARRSRRRGDPADRGRGRHQSADARLGPVHARPDADPLVAHARHREGGAAHRRPLTRGGAPLHAPLQLPALLGRGDGLHARPEAA